MTTIETRQRKIRGLSSALTDSAFRERLIHAYLFDTAFTYSNINDREILSPSMILNLLTDFIDQDKTLRLKERRPLGKVAVLLPKNGIGLIIAKALASSYLMGNHSVVKIPSQLNGSSDIYSELILDHLDATEFVPSSVSSRDFLLESMNDPEIKAVVVYGDDTWIGSYMDLARSTRTKLIFEGPGNDPQIVFPDADIEKATDHAILGGLLNGGQSCSAFERFFVHENIHDEFVTALCDKLSQIRYGDPADPSVQLGPIKSSKVLNRIKSQVSEAVAAGGKLELGGERYHSSHNGMEIVVPTVISNCNPDMTVVRDETFGPVFPIIRFGNDVENLIHDIDRSTYGLNASVYGGSPDVLNNYLHSSHRNFYHDSTYACSVNFDSKLNDGGYKNSGFISEWKDGAYIKRTGRRILLQELSVG